MADLIMPEIPQNASKITTAAFLSRLGPRNFLRAIWPEKQLGPCPADMKDSYAHYGEYTEVIAKKLQVLNDQGYSIFYGANDPGCATFKEALVTMLRLIYRDADHTEEPSPWKLAGGETIHPHFHYITSPGKSQSVWLIEPISSEYQSRIHSVMVVGHGHDASTGGAARLLRLPGFANTKYPEKPLVRIVSAL